STQRTKSVFSIFKITAFRSIFCKKPKISQNNFSHNLSKKNSKLAPFIRHTFANILAFMVKLRAKSQIAENNSIPCWNIQRFLLRTFFRKSLGFEFMVRINGQNRFPAFEKYLKSYKKHRQN